MTQLGGDGYFISYDLLDEEDTVTKPTEIKFGNNVLTLNYSATGAFMGSSNDELLDVVLASVGLTSLDELAAGEIQASEAKSLLPSAQTLQLWDVWSRIGEIAIKPNKKIETFTQEKQLKLLDFQEDLLTKIALLDGFVSHKENDDFLGTTNQVGAGLLSNENSLLSLVDLYSAGAVNYDVFSGKVVSKTLTEPGVIDPNSELAWLAAITYSEVMTAKNNGESLDMYVLAKKIFNQAKIIESSSDETLYEKYGYPVDGSIIKGVISSFNAELPSYSSYEGAFYNEFMLGLQESFNFTIKADAETSIEAAVFASILAENDSSIAAIDVYENWADRPYYDVIYAGTNQPFFKLVDWGIVDNDFVEIYQDGQLITSIAQATGPGTRIELNPLKKDGSEFVITALNQGSLSPATIAIDIPNAIYGENRYQRTLATGQQIRFTMGVPEINIQGLQAPEAARHVRDVLGEPTRVTLNRKDVAVREQRRALAQGLFRFSNGDDPIYKLTEFELDEVPFAALEEGGVAFVRPIPGGDNSRGGTSFSNQINRYGPDNIELADGVVFDLWTTTIVGSKTQSMASSNTTLSGTPSEDYLYGRDISFREDYISGEGGNDIIFAYRGNDNLYGNSGDDILFGQGGNDLLVGGSGADTIVGGLGEDSMWGDDEYGVQLGTVDSFVLDIRYDYISDKIFDFDIYNDKLVFQQIQVKSIQDLAVEQYFDEDGDEGIAIFYGEGISESGVNSNSRRIAILDGTHVKDRTSRPTIDSLNSRGGIASIVRFI